MLKTLASADSSKALNPTLLALKPRQVLLSRPDMGKKEAGESESKTLNLMKPDEKVLLLRSIAQYLDRCGFSKCLKKFLSEAEIEKKDLGSSLPDLEEIYCQYLKRSPEAGDSSKQKTEDMQTYGRKEEENASDNHKNGERNNKKKKKESKSENKKETDVKIVEEPKSCDTNAAEASKDAYADVEKGQKDKKKKKKESKSGVTKEKVKDGSSENKTKTDVEMGEGQKDKKKKKKSKAGESEALDDDKTQEENEVEKVSKKRKRPENEEENEQKMDDKMDEESKRRKKDDDIDVNGDQKTPAKQPEVKENGNLENTGAKSTNQKSDKNKLNGSKEPKKPFQRVNVEEVEFVDDRLKDNSYWAKDGADSGYGAKAQEVLGQVRGRGFRHEKTKKKRGSYRGGQIDLDSHSVKFNYSDEE
ncbi:PREDICTED: nucleolar and coiled-body phosphoprotein 1-like isoform X2 [Tarenaya hassleriana]|uniref:nucleolar and coiled-body phosphoprotein 1-like isoform X2 n=1 Tax=Tarenaya hassleriana TaxID=28532 RepID=UPI00053C4A37|nr:PREDICTED: nucleolar and coiled-body phosphoprotein 1-like isoform X2 [Tarenaya hassleriana]